MADNCKRNDDYLEKDFRRSTDKCIEPPLPVARDVISNQMKYLLPIIICFFSLNLIHGQYLQNCFPYDLIVTGDGVNFRAEPNTNSAPMGKLTNGEFLIFKEVVQSNENLNWISMDESWLKVQRVSSGEIGFVYGKYVRPQEAIHPTGNKIQNGNWYGLYKEGSKVIIEKSKPTFFINNEGDTAIIGNNARQQILICSQAALQEGAINGRFYQEHEGLLSIGKKLELVSIKNNNFSMACTGEVELGTWMGFTRKNERIYFITERMDGSQRYYTKQDLTDCILKFGEDGYQLVFAGDLNNDGIPEIIFYEATNAESIMYYFMSNKEGQLELKSIAYGVDNC